MRRTREQQRLDAAMLVAELDLEMLHALAVAHEPEVPGRLYPEHPIEVLTEDAGDCQARLQLRMREIGASVAWLRRVLESPAAGLADDRLVPPGAVRPDTLCVTVREGFRGPVVQALETGADGRLVHCKLQDPSMQNWFGLALAVRDNEISDFPICNKSFDLSYCGNDL